MVVAKDVWMGAIWWGGGAMWDDGSVKDKPEYVYRMEPPNGVGYKAYADILAKYVSK
jgi:endoglucanase